MLFTNNDINTMLRTIVENGIHNTLLRKTISIIYTTLIHNFISGKIALQVYYEIYFIECYI